MSEAQPTETPRIVRNISDTARWAAVFRARETERPDAIFRDPYADRLAGTLGVDIANSLPEGNSHAWAWVARTYLFDQFIEREIQQGVDMVVNLAAGLDATAVSHGASPVPRVDGGRSAGNPRVQGRNPCERKTALRFGARPLGSFRRPGTAETIRRARSPRQENPGSHRRVAHLSRCRRGRLACQGSRRRPAFSDAGSPISPHRGSCA